MPGEPENYCLEMCLQFSVCVVSMGIHRIDTFATLDSRDSFDATERIVRPRIGEVGANNE